MPRHPLAVQLATCALVAIVLVVALSAVEGKIAERAGTRAEAVARIQQQFAGEQRIDGPWLAIDCIERVERVRHDDGKRSAVIEERDCSRRVEADRAEVEAVLDAGRRKLGIYGATIYESKVRVSASFPRIERRAGETWRAASVVVGIADPRGIRAVALRDGAQRPLEARPGSPGLAGIGGFHAPVELAAGATEIAPSRVDAQIELAGSAGFGFVPSARSTALSVSADWPHPSFGGAFLPEAHRIDERGFAAHWRLSDLAAGGARAAERPQASAAGDAVPAPLALVSLIDPVDPYVRSMRAVQYGFLIVGFVLGAAFLFETLSGRRLHPIESLQTGGALVAFFLLLFALSEHIDFGTAYAVAASASLAIVAYYLRHVLGGVRPAAAATALLAAAFGTMYGLLLSEDHALLLGALAVFGALSASMILTRRLDWRAVGAPRPGPAVPRAGATAPRPAES